MSQTPRSSRPVMRSIGWGGAVLLRAAHVLSGRHFAQLLNA